MRRDRSIGLAARMIAALVAMAATAACSTIETVQDGPNTSGFPIHGIDVSKYQGRIDWPAAAQGGVRFAYLKATEGGDRKDDMFEVNWQGARAAGIPTGAYHFYYFCRPVEDQVAWFKTHVPPAADALPPVLDMEWNPDSPTCKKRPPADQIRRDMNVFLSEMQAFYGKKPIVYTTVDFHRDVLPSHLDEHRFWLRSVASHPSKKYAGRDWTFWQYTATGTVPGVKGRVDRNVFAGSEADWQAFLAQGGRPQLATISASVD